MRYSARNICSRVREDRGANKCRDGRIGRYPALEQMARWALYDINRPRAKRHVKISVVFNVISEFPIAMNEINPYEPTSPLLGRRPCGNMIRRAARAASLGAVGCGVYFAGVSVASVADDENWGWRAGIIAFAFTTSEIFAVQKWSLKRSLLRRLIVSCSITIASVVIGGSLFTLAGIGMLRHRTPLMLLRWNAIVLLVFVVLALIFLRLLRLPSRTQ